MGTDVRSLRSATPLRDRLSRADGRAADARAAAQSGARPRRHDRRLIMTVGSRCPVDRADPAVAARRRALDRGQVVSIAYPIGDILLIAAAIRLALDSGRPPGVPPAPRASWPCSSPTSPTDCSPSLGPYDGQLWLDVGWISSYLLWGAAGCTPRWPELDRPAPDRELALSRFGWSCSPAPPWSRR